MKVDFTNDKKTFDVGHEAKNTEFNTDMSTGGGIDGKNGATFIPAVSPDGVISWTNDKNLPNPKPMNIKGKDGADGYTPVKGVDYFDGKDGEDGKNGIDGKDGADGYTPVKGVDYFDGKDGESITITRSETATLTDGSKRTNVTFSDGSKVSIFGGTKGEDGERGAGILKVTTSPSSYNFNIDGVTTSYRIAKSYVTTESGITNVLVGDTILYSYYLYKVVLVDTSYVYLGTRTTIRGATGAAGSAGAAGERGTGILPITTEPKSSLLVVGNFTSTYNIPLSTVLSQAGVTKVLVGDILEYGSYHYTVGYVDTSKVYSNTRKSIKGDPGADGTNGYTPQKGTDYYTEEDKAEMVQSVLAALPTWEGGSY